MINQIPETNGTTTSPSAIEQHDLVVIGRKTDKNDLEDLWMSKVSNLEHQYDEHLRHLQRRLFDHRVDRKLVTKLREENEYMKYKLDKMVQEQKDMGNRMVKLDQERKTKERQVKSIKAKLSTAILLKDNLTKQVNAKSKELQDSQKKQGQLIRKLSLMEHDRDDLKKITQDMTFSRADLTHSIRTEEIEKKRLAFKLSQLDTERRVQTAGNLKLLDTISDLINNAGDKEERLYKMQSEINALMRQLRNEKDKEKVLIRQQSLFQSQLSDVQDELIRTKEEFEQEQMKARHWKEESEFQQLMNKKTEQGKRNEYSALLGQIAQLKLQIKGLEQKMSSHEFERMRLIKKLEILPAIQKSLQQVTKVNQNRRRRLMSMRTTSSSNTSIEIETGSPYDDPFGYFHQETIKKRAKEAFESRQQALKERHTLHPTLKYEKEIASLQSQLKILDSKLKECQRKENLARLELKTKVQIKEELFWREKAMLALEKENKRIDEITRKVVAEIGTKFGKSLDGIFSPKAKSKQLQQKLSETRIFIQIQSQQELIHQLRTSCTLPKVNHPSIEQEKLRMQEYLTMECGELQKSVEQLGKEMRQLEKKGEILKKMRPTILSSGRSSVMATPPEMAPGVAVGAEDEVNENALSEEELLETVHKQLDVPGMKFEDVPDRSMQSASSSSSSHGKESDQEDKNLRKVSPPVSESPKSPASSVSDSVEA